MRREQTRAALEDRIQKTKAGEPVHVPAGHGLCSRCQVVHPISAFNVEQGRRWQIAPACRDSRRPGRKAADALRQEREGDRLNAEREARRTTEQERDKKARRVARERAAGPLVLHPGDRERLGLDGRPVPCTYCSELVLIAKAVSERTVLTEQGLQLQAAARAAGEALPYGAIDHIVALVNGGTHDGSNLTPACVPCNSRKGVQ